MGESVAMMRRCLCQLFSVVSEGGKQGEKERLPGAWGMAWEQGGFL